MMPKEPNVFRPAWPNGLHAKTAYRIPCDDKGRNGGSWLELYVSDDGDVHVSMQDWEEIPDGQPSMNPYIRIRTLSGGGRHLRTRQALLWLADAIRRDMGIEEHEAEDMVGIEHTNQNVIDYSGSRTGDNK